MKLKTAAIVAEPIGGSCGWTWIIVKIAVMGLCIVFFFDLSFAAQISSHLKNTNVTWANMYINGEIERGDSIEFLSHLNDMKKKENAVIHVWIDSRGGDALEAIKIGKIIRNNYIITGVDPFKQCYSAGFLIWAGGIERHGYEGSGETIGNIGIHRPYYAKEYFKGLTAKQAEKKYVQMSENVKSYLKEMNVLNYIIETMFKHSSNEIYLLNKDDLSRLRKCPFFAEWVISKCGGFSEEEEIEMRDLDRKKNTVGVTLTNAQKYYLDSLKKKEWDQRQCLWDSISEAQLKNQ